MNITHLDVLNFKGIDKIELSPKSINIIVGRNNTCKTSLLEAIGLVVDEEKIKSYNKKYRDFSGLIKAGCKESIINVVTTDGNKMLKIDRSHKENVISEFKKEFTIRLEKLLNSRKINVSENDKKNLEEKLGTLIDENLLRELVKESLTITSNNGERTFFSFDSTESKKLIEGICESIAKYLKDNLKLDIDLDFIVFSFIYPDIIPTGFTSEKGSNVIFIKNLIKMDIHPQAQEDVAILNKIEEFIKKYDLLKNFDRFDSGYVIFKYNGDVTPIRYTYMGDGFKVLVGLLWILSSSKIENKILLLEEPENHMHPGYIYQLIKFIIKFSKEANIQFFITSHSSDLVESFLGDNILEDKGYLKNELLIIRMEKIKKYITPELMDYETAKTNMKELLLDLRGI